jgi:hypothetical protein
MMRPTPVHPARGPCGGIGRRGRLKICFPKGSGSSTLPGGTKHTKDLNHRPRTAMRSLVLCVHTMSAKNAPAADANFVCLTEGPTKLTEESAGGGGVPHREVPKPDAGLAQRQTLAAVAPPGSGGRAPKPSAPPSGSVISPSPCCSWTRRLRWRYMALTG